MSDRLIGKTLAGRFVLEEMLGTGATGSVFLAQQTSVDRVVAVKTLHPFLQQREDFKARFEIEAKAIARLNHPNCITLYDFGYDEQFDVFYMAVEYIKGEMLADLMAEPVAYEDVMSLSYQIAEGLEHAHREGILHRDLKPENIMIQRSPGSGRLMVKVLDFGLARLYEADVDQGDEPPSGRYKQITQAGQVYGTPAYMSPEQCRAHEELSPATDLYALGTMMFELFEGRLPFFSKSTAELIMMQMTDEPPKMERIDVPADVRDLVFRMMAKNPLERPQSARDVLITLLPHVRLDASQEFRILPTTSGDFAKLTPEQIAAFSNSGPLVPPNPPTLDLSDEELRVAQTSRRSLVVFGVLAVLIGFLGAIVLASLDDHGDASATPVAVDAPVAVVADSGLAEAEAAPDEPVEVAKNVEEDEKPQKRRKSKKSTSRGSTSTSDKKASVSDADRPKTLKLTY